MTRSGDDRLQYPTADMELSPLIRENTIPGKRDAALASLTGVLFLMARTRRYAFIRQAASTRVRVSVIGNDCTSSGIGESINQVAYNCKRTPNSATRERIRRFASLPG